MAGNQIASEKDHFVRQEMFPKLTYMLSFCSPFVNSNVRYLETR